MNRKLTLPFLILLAIAITTFIANYSKIVNPTRSSPRQIIEQVHFENLWSHEDIFIAGNIFFNPDGFIEIESNNLLLLTVQRKFFTHNWVLKKKNLFTGERIKEIDFGRTVIKGVINNTSNIYVASSIQRGCGFVWKPNCEAIKVVAYDIGENDEQWTQVYDGMLNINWIKVDEEILELHGSANRGNHRATFRIDTNTGETIWSGNPTLSLQEIQEKSKQQPEYFVPQEVNSPVISNVKICNNIAYLVTKNGRLWAIEQKSRSILGMVTFSLTEHEMTIFDAQVLCKDNVVVIYFDDSRQIFTFRFLESNDSE